MKKILITGKGSYLGQRLMAYLKDDANFSLYELDVQDDAWQAHDFSAYDSIFHVAGIVHRNQNEVGEELYYRVNTDLAIALAQKAKESGVGQFILMSTASVFGSQTQITISTKPAPNNFYGKSKLKAEEGISALADEHFHVAILRPPMIYGQGARGNYPRIASLARKIPIFPKVANRRSMIFIGNFNEFVKNLIASGQSGIFHPQDKEYMNTSWMVKTIARVHGKKLLLVPGFNTLSRFMAKHNGLFNKLFGDFVYEQSLSKADFAYQKYEAKEAIRLSELGK